MVDFEDFEIENSRESVIKSRIENIEKSVKAKPTQKDLKETVKLLRDFGIHIEISDIPDCYNVAALQRWRIKKIQSRKW